MTKSIKYDTVVNTPFKRLGLRGNDERVTEIHFLDADAEPKQSLDLALLQATAEIKQYCTNPDTEFTFKYELKGTDFEKRVWDAIARIPRGEVRTYKELADELGTSPRAVGNACAKNPIPVVIPCHRVVASNGFGGYCGETLDESPKGLIRIKGWLLLHEGVLKAQMNGEDVDK